MQDFLQRSCAKIFNSKFVNEKVKPILKKNKYIKSSLVSVRDYIYSFNAQNNIQKLSDKHFLYDIKQQVEKERDKRA